MPKKHYVYSIKFETGHIYYGVRSCGCDPKLDPYLGSPATHKDYWEKYEPTKEIIADDFPTREDANSFETFCIELQWIKNKTLSLNASIGGVKFCTLGVKQSEETVALRAAKKSGPFYLVSPDGEIFEGKNLTKFCEENNLSQSNLREVSIGKRLHHKGWTSSLKNHQTYLKCFENRGLDYHKRTARWRVRWVVDGKQKEIRFKEKSDAVSYRHILELAGYEFNLKPIGWKNYKEQL